MAKPVYCELQPSHGQNPVAGDAAATSPVRITKSKLATIRGSQHAVHDHSVFNRPGALVDQAMERAKILLAIRDGRDRDLDAQLFGDPAWDMLLFLFTQRFAGERTTATMACDASRAPPTTALRYISMLASKQLISKRVADHDLRVHYLELTEGTYLTLIDLLTS